MLQILEHTPNKLVVTAPHRRKNPQKVAILLSLMCLIVGISVVPLWFVRARRKILMGIYDAQYDSIHSLFFKQSLIIFALTSIVFIGLFLIFYYVNVEYTFDKSLNCYKVLQKSVFHKRNLKGNLSEFTRMTFLQPKKSNSFFSISRYEMKSASPENIWYCQLYSAFLSCSTGKFIGISNMKDGQESVVKIIYDFLGFG
jgi:uncharacterized membrane protein